MKKTLDEILESARNASSSEPLFQENEILSAIRTIEASQPSLIKKILSHIKRRKTMYYISSSIVIALLSSLLYFGNNIFNSEVQLQKLHKSEIMKSINERTDNQVLFAQIEVKENISIDLKSGNVIKQNKINQMNNDTLKVKRASSQGNVVMGYSISTFTDTSTNKREYMEKTDWNLDVQGINIITMSIEDLKKFNISLKLDDTTFTIQEERILQYKENKYKYWNLEELGYPVDSAEFLVKFYFKLTPKSSQYPIFYPYQGWSVKDYNRTLFVAYSLGTAKTILKSPLLRYGNSVLNYYYMLDTNSGRKMLELIEKGDKEEIKAYSLYMQDITKNMLKRLVPVYVQLNKNMYIILWFIPNKEFLEKLPPKVSYNIKNELEVLENIESGNMSIQEACKGLISEETYFDVCRMSSGALVKMELYPNPAKEEMTCKFTLSDSRKINISIHDIYGKSLKTFVKGKEFGAGEQEVKLNPEEIQSGFYIISITSNEGEQILQRCILQK